VFFAVHVAVAVVVHVHDHVHDHGYVAVDDGAGRRWGCEASDWGGTTSWDGGDEHACRWERRGARGGWRVGATTYGWGFRSCG
jgi:hypothetical protein